MKALIKITLFAAICTIFISCGTDGNYWSGPRNLTYEAQTQQYTPHKQCEMRALFFIVTNIRSGNSYHSPIVDCDTTKFNIDGIASHDWVNVKYDAQEMTFIVSFEECDVPLREVLIEYDDGWTEGGEIGIRQYGQGYYQSN